MKVSPHIDNIYLFFTNMCNSRCLTCNIWQNKDKDELEFNQFTDIVTSDVIDKESVICLLGGEFTIYSRYIEVVKFLNAHEQPYVMFTNALLPKKVHQLVAETELKSLSISVDGFGAGHDYVRGVKGNFAKVEELIDWMRENSPATRLTVGFTASKYNTKEDLKKVMIFANEKDVELRVTVAVDTGIYMLGDGDMAGSEVAGDLYSFDDILEDEDVLPRDRQFLKLYTAWKNGWYNPCEGSLHNPIVYNSGAVLLCHDAGTEIGNLYIQSFSDIWNEKFAIDKREEWSVCNKCWFQCYRNHDSRKIDESTIDLIVRKYTKNGGSD